ncbi:hypothetical protein BZA05DRAFT_471414 [Tricharina praecox]|uniref:uncharacterized protein n=1 Tax=Tricharina praecox TaxID=43433 RepID=UPI00221E9354|nr:uncharacterized protein BZA05DRAFT_471414 [Tricharina praecox]KAI5856303.1 hypothetical protein BZA05DRAFT_471414 [Tricharina praecox]
MSNIDEEKAIPVAIYRSGINKEGNVVKFTGKGMVRMTEREVNGDDSGTTMIGDDDEYRINMSYFHDVDLPPYPTGPRPLHASPPLHPTNGLHSTLLHPPGLEQVSPRPSPADMTDEEWDAELAVCFGSPLAPSFGAPLARSTTPHHPQAPDVLPLRHFRTRHGTPSITSARSSASGESTPSLSHSVTSISPLTHAYRAFMHKLPHYTFTYVPAPPSACIACDALSAHYRCANCPLVLCRTCVDLIGRLGGSIHRLIGVVARWKLGYSVPARERDGSVWGAGPFPPGRKKAMVVGEVRDDLDDDSDSNSSQGQGGVRLGEDYEDQREDDQNDNASSIWEDFDDDWSEGDGCEAATGDVSEEEEWY